MREMKDSGIEWIGEIPADWKVVKNKYLLSLLYSGGTPSVSNNDFYCFEGGTPFVSISDMSTVDYVLSTQKRLTGSGLKDKNLKILPIGTILYSIYATVGAVSELKIEAAISQAMLALQVNSKVNKSFYKYNLAAMKDYIFSNANGNTQFNLNAEKVKNFYFVLPNVATQHRIANYLDRKSSQIDAIIARQQEVIEKLKAYKLSIITEAVTKGLNPNVPMKDSGVEWIGEVPEHWNILKLQAHTQMLTPMRDRPEKLDGDIPWVRIEDYDGKYISASKEGLGVSTETVKEMNLKIYPVGSILCTSSCDLGKCAIVARELVSNQRFINIIPDSNTNSDYLYYLMLSNAERLNHLSTGTIQANLSRKAFEHLMVQFPPISEQKEIAYYLDIKCEIIEFSIRKKQELIDRLSSYKKSLIYEVVTGKKEV
ncbi:restriction endonuclease subunit S [Intestinimonas butyriciproducens]|uniref:restriction endonuclease subunit S n=1 Tax=Intestinimonas butyriciproducens TaxID=1297617 RepID=UPI00195A616C|nr:restriction endonuclease subunit S [Intestinimonas butyriciproducens]MBM6974305.1 restriction endonuclease subunit S [Intestinimonas butyriciproducens]